MRKGYCVRQLVSRHLEHFLALCRTRNMHLAAAHTGVSQPALTRSLKILEAAFAAELFRRTPRGLEITEAGAALLRHVRAVEQAARLAEMEVRAVGDTLRGTVRIGVGQVLAVSAFPQLAVDVHHRFPDLAMVIRTGIAGELVNKLVRHDLDLVAAAMPEDPLPDGFLAQPLFETGMAVICRDKHPLHAARAPGLDALRRYRRVGFIEDHDFDVRALRAFGERPPPPAIETTSVNVMFGILAATDHVSIVSDLIVAPAERAGLRRLRLAQPLWRLRIAAICRDTLQSARPVVAIRQALSAIAPTAGVASTQAEKDRRLGG